MRRVIDVKITYDNSFWARGTYRQTQFAFEKSSTPGFGNLWIEFDSGEWILNRAMISYQTYYTQLMGAIDYYLDHPNRIDPAKI